MKTMKVVKVVLDNLGFGFVFLMTLFSGGVFGVYGRGWGSYMAEKAGLSFEHVWPGSVLGAIGGVAFGIVLSTFCFCIRMPFPSIDESEPGRIPWRIFTVTVLLLTVGATIAHLNYLDRQFFGISNPF